MPKSKFNTIPHLNTLHWRCIGPPRGGRVVAVAEIHKIRRYFILVLQLEASGKQMMEVYFGKIYQTVSWKVLR